MIFDPENFKDNKSNWVTTFPIYNATETNRQKYVDKYVWEFNSDNAITSELMSSDVYPSNARKVILSMVQHMTKLRHLLRTIRL